jgi:hypothetical protein
MDVHGETEGAVLQRGRGLQSDGGVTSDAAISTAARGSSTEVVQRRVLRSGVSGGSTRSVRSPYTEPLCSCMYLAGCQWPPTSCRWST